MSYKEIKTLAGFQVFQSQEEYDDFIHKYCDCSACKQGHSFCFRRIYNELPENAVKIQGNNETVYEVRTARGVYWFSEITGDPGKYFMTNIMRSLEN